MIYHSLALWLLFSFTDYFYYCHNHHHHHHHNYSIYKAPSVAKKHELERLQLFKHETVSSFLGVVKGMCESFMFGWCCPGGCEEHGQDSTASGISPGIFRHSSAAAQGWCQYPTARWGRRHGSSLLSIRVLTACWQHSSLLLVIWHRWLGIEHVL